MDKQPAAADDLIERLREGSRHYATTTYSKALFLEAADELARLRADVESLRQEITALHATEQNLQAKADAALARLNWLLDDYRSTDLYHAIGVLCSSDKEKCYAAIDAALKGETP